MNFLFVADALSELRARKDSTVALMRAAAAAGDAVYATTLGGFLLSAGGASFSCKLLSLSDGDNWYTAAESQTLSAAHFDAILMRKEPPVDGDFINATLLLDVAAKTAPVFNSPQALRDLNEKLAIFYFPDLIPDTLVSANPTAILDFHKKQHGAVIKPLDGMGGAGVYVSPDNDKNLRSVLALQSDDGRKLLMAQQYLPAAAVADCRVFLIDGKPAKWMLARTPPPDDYRGNMAIGGRAEARPLGKTERDIAQKTAAVLTKMGIIFAGLDIIGDKLTEINITCPTGLAEVRAQTGDDLSAAVMAAIKNKCH